MEIEGRFLRQRKDLVCAARVKLILVESAQSTEVKVIWPLSYPDWKLGAIQGINYAFKKTASSQAYLIEVTDIIGSTVDTNATIVAIAAIDAIWKALNYSATLTEWQQLEELAKESWQKEKAGQCPIIPFS